MPVVFAIVSAYVSAHSSELDGRRMEKFVHNSVLRDVHDDERRVGAFQVI